MKVNHKTHHEMIREAVTELKEARPRAIMEYIRRKYPHVKVKESSFRADIIGCSVNHSSSHHYPGMPKFLLYEKQKGTYRLFNPTRDEKIVSFEVSQNILRSVQSGPEITNNEVNVGREVLRAFNQGIGIFEDQHSESLNSEGFENDLYLNYITFTSAIDYQKNIEANDLWRVSKRWAKEYPWLFKPNEVLKKPTAQVIAAFESIRENDKRFFRLQDIGIWLFIADALEAYGGTTLKLLESFDFDAWKIYSEFKGRLKKQFPFLSGEKILPMWLKILHEDAGVQLKNMEKLPLPVDKNVAEVTFNLVFKKKFSGNVDTKTIEDVRAVWKQIADKLNVPVISFDTPLWVLGGNEGCSNLQKSNCKKCPVNKYCQIYLANNVTR